MIKVTKNGYTATLYGESSLSIIDEKGKEVFHSGSTYIKTKKQLYNFLDTLPELLSKLELIIIDTVDEDSHI